jgi:hydroxylamine dehydrogenase
MGQSGEPTPAEADSQPTRGRSLRLFIVGLVVLAVVAGMALVMRAITEAGSIRDAQMVDALANSRDDCVTCHRDKSPGIVQQYGHSTMASAEVTCRDCHEVPSDYPGATEHEGTYVLRSPTTARCQKCHEQQVAQYYQSRHSLPAYVAYAGSQDLPDPLLAMYQAIPEGSYAPDKSRHALYAIEGAGVTRFACETCHDVGLPNPDGSVGQCQKCHLRHQFSLEQARKPETCNACHIGPDHPQWEIYQESPHGIAYMTAGHSWNWEADPGTLRVTDFPAATCAVCHMSGFGSSETTHDVGDRLSWYLFAPISERRPDWESNLQRMWGVCLECHNENFISSFYADADKATESINDWVKQSDQIVQPLKDQGLLTKDPFDEPIDYTYFELWHHWGRTAKFGSWMQGPDYVQWHGIYEMLSDLAELREMVQQKLDSHNRGE